MARKVKKLFPEVICLSDDDDDDDNNDNNTTKTNTPIVTPVKQQESPDRIKRDHQSDTNDSSNWIIDPKDVIRIPDLPSRYSDIYKQPFEIRCVAIRFGIVEFNVEFEVIQMKEVEFEMKLKSGFQDTINMKLAYSDIVAFYFSFQSQIPAAFIQVRKEFADLFDRHIPTSDDQGRGFDPNSKDIKRRRIVFCLKSLTPDMEKIHVSTIYHFLKSKCPKMDICCVNGSRAEELYDLTRFARLPVVVCVKTPFALDAKDLLPKTVSLNNNTIRFDLSRDDLYCLNEGEYLNDNIIDFYLQYIYHEKLSEEDRKRTYLFNSFFYTRLTKAGNNDNPRISAAERRYNRVKRWVRDVDIFSKDYLIVPINQTAHWYIVIIQYPNYAPTEADLISDDDDESLEDRLRWKKKKVSERIINSTVSNSVASESSSSSSSKSILPAIEFLDEADEGLSDSDIDFEPNMESLLNNKSHPQYPAIVIFDSLRISSKRRVAATLREFLQLEYDHKKTLPSGSLARKLFNIDTIPTIEAAVPQQLNYYDCGLYVLQYVESFFAHRCSTINFRLSSTFANWCEKTSMGSSKRQQILNVINKHGIVKND